MARALQRYVDRPGVAGKDVEALCGYGFSSMCLKGDGILNLLGRTKLPHPYTRSYYE